MKFPWRLQVGQACWLAEDAWPGNLAPISSLILLVQDAYRCTGNHNFRSASAPDP